MYIYIINFKRNKDNSGKKLPTFLYKQIVYPNDSEGVCASSQSQIRKRKLETERLKLFQQTNLSKSFPFDTSGNCLSHKGNRTNFQGKIYKPL